MTAINLNDLKTKQSKSEPSPKRPNVRSDRRTAQMEATGQVSSSAIAQSSTAIVGKAAQSLQTLDAQLSRFEDSYAEATVQRMAEVPGRINAKIASRLQQLAQADPLESLTVSVESWEIPDLSFNCPAIAPASAMGCLPM